MFQRIMDEVVTSVYRHGWTRIWSAVVHNRNITTTIAPLVTEAASANERPPEDMEEMIPEVPVDALSSMSVASPGSPPTVAGEVVEASTLTTEALGAADDTPRLTRHDRPPTLGSSGSDVTQLPTNWRCGVRHASRSESVEPF